MKKLFNNKRIIFFTIFLLLVVFAVCFTMKNGSLSFKKLNDEVALDDDSNEEINLGDEKTSCKEKDYTKCGCDSIGDPSGKDQCKKNCSYCKSCNSGHELKNSYCYKKDDPPKLSGITLDGSDYIYLAKDEVANFSFTATSKPTNANGFAPTWSLNPTTGATGTANGSKYTLQASGNGAGKLTECKETKYTVTASFGGESKTSTVKVCKYCSEWRGPIKTKLLYKNRQNTSKPNKGCYYFEGEQEVKGGWSYTAYYTRCCSEPKSDFGGCYGNNKKYLGLATKAEWNNEPTETLPYKYEGVKEEDCHPITVNVCSSKPIPSIDKEENTDYCEDSKKITTSDGIKCSNYQTSGEQNFYTIKCDREITTKFDYGDDNDLNSSRILYKGQGFKFGIKVTSVHTCTATFKKDIWTNVYNQFLKKLDFISTSLRYYVDRYDYNGYKKAVDALKTTEDVKKDVYELWNIIKDLRNIVIEDYKRFKPSNSYNEDTNLQLTYSVNGKNETINEQFIISDNDFDEGLYTKVESSNKYDLTTGIKNVPESFVITNEDNPRVVKMIPKNAYIEKYLGRELSIDQRNINGGNKIYLSYDTDKTTGGKTYPMTIVVSGLGSNKSKVTNDKCDVQVLEGKILYRPIDVSNPFINSSWKIGENWVNKDYSFTNTIKSDIWSKKSNYNISISSDEIKEIVSSNQNNKDKYPYLGLCNRVGSAYQDNVTKKICKIVKTIE